MSRHAGRARTAAIVLVTTAAVGLVGCGSGGRGEASTDSRRSTRCELTVGASEPALVEPSTDEVTLRAWRGGAPLSLAEFRRLQSAESGAGGYNDVLLDPDALVARVMSPLGGDSAGPAGRDPSFVWPGGPVTFSTAWPTASGYVNLLVDLDRPGTWLFELLAARQSATRLVDFLERAATPVTSASYQRNCATLNDALAAAAASSDEAERAEAGRVALDAVTAAWSDAMIEVGTARRGAGDVDDGYQWGVTFDDDGDLAEPIAALDRAWPRDDSRPWVRLVLDPDRPPAEYAPAVEELDAADLAVTGLVIDSSEMADLDVDATADRWADATATLSGVDQWEIGNEANGEWLGSDVTTKIGVAADAAAATGTPTLLTLYWQLGEADEEHSLFTWIDRHLDDALLAKVDAIGLSIYPGDHPMGPAAFDRVVTTLSARFGDTPIVIAELGYGSPDLGGRWWWGDHDDPDGAGRRAVLDLYQRGLRAYDEISGGAYWWYFLEEMTDGSALLEAWSRAVSPQA